MDADAEMDTDGHGRTRNHIWATVNHSKSKMSTLTPRGVGGDYKH